MTTRQAEEVMAAGMLLADEYDAEYRVHDSARGDVSVKWPASVPDSYIAYNSVSIGHRGTMIHCRVILPGDGFRVEISREFNSDISGTVIARAVVQIIEKFLVDEMRYIQDFYSEVALKTHLFAGIYHAIVAKNGSERAGAFVKSNSNDAFNWFRAFHVGGGSWRLWNMTGMGPREDGRLIFEGSIDGAIKKMVDNQPSQGDA